MSKKTHITKENEIANLNLVIDNKQIAQKIEDAFEEICDEIREFRKQEDERLEAISIEQEQEEK